MIKDLFAITAMLVALAISSSIAHADDDGGGVGGTTSTTTAIVSMDSTTSFGLLTPACFIDFFFCFFLFFGTSKAIVQVSFVSCITTLR